MKLLRANNEIDMRQILEERSAAHLCHAAKKTKNNVWPLVGDAAEHSHFAERLLIGHVANAAGIQQHHVRFLLAVGAFVAAGDERMRDLFRVAFIHLAAVGFNEKLGHGRAK